MRGIRKGSFLIHFFNFAFAQVGKIIKVPMFLLKIRLQQDKNTNDHDKKKKSFHDGIYFLIEKKFSQ